MTHHTVEVQCPRCVRYRCICPPPPDSTSDYFVVDADFTVLTKAAFLQKHAGNPMAYTRLTLAALYRERHNAEIAAREHCEQATEQARTNLLRLKHILKVQRPWEAT